ncbi:helix-turn-helix domain-containing protein [Bifidobacterium goeldii]|nr:helix-turn-helix transcriptional regulator [Bifidobacterium goeldii]
MPRTRYVSDLTATQSHALLAAQVVTLPHDLAQSTTTVVSLTEREREVMRLCAQGRSSREIGELLGVGESSVKTYVMRAAKKLGARNRTQAVAEWLMLQD